MMQDDLLHLQGVCRFFLLGSVHSRRHNVAFVLLVYQLDKRTALVYVMESLDVAVVV
jgi:hypothetical protein